MTSRREQWTIELADGHATTVSAYLTRDDAPAVVVWPALGVPSRFYSRIAEELSTRGFSAILADYRGQSGNPPRVGRGTRLGYHDFAAVDLPAVTAAVRDRMPRSPVLLLGHSIGGQIGLCYASRYQADIDGVVLVAASTPYFRAFSGVLAVRTFAAIHLVNSIAATVGFWPGDRMGAFGRQPRTLVRDWARLCRTGSFDFDDPDARYDRDLATLRLPVLAVSVEGDTYAPPSAVDSLCSHIARAPLTRWHYVPADGPTDHFSWAKRPAPIADRIDHWWRTDVAAKPPASPLLRTSDPDGRG